MRRDITHQRTPVLIYPAAKKKAKVLKYCSTLKAARDRDVAAKAEREPEDYALYSLRIGYETNFWLGETYQR